MSRVSSHSTQLYRVVIVGGGFAGLSAAFEARAHLRAADRVTVISHSTHFVFAPSLVWVALGQRRSHSSFALEPALAARNIEFIRDHVREVRVANQCVVTDAREIQYDRLIIATGGHPNAQSIPGLAGEFRHARRIPDISRAEWAKSRHRTWPPHLDTERRPRERCHELSTYGYWTGATRASCSPRAGTERSTTARVSCRDRRLTI